MDECKSDKGRLVRIVDYKSYGKKFELSEFYDGLSIQLPVYMAAALETLYKDDKENVSPAGIFYYATKDPMIGIEDKQGEDELLNSVLKELRMEGMFLSTSEAMDAMDENTEGTSGVIAMNRKKDGSCMKTNCCASPSQMADLLAYAAKLADAAVEDMKNADVSINPYKKGDKTACDFCPFSTVCGFDPTLPGFSFRKLSDLKDDEIFELIRQKDEDGENQ